MLSTWNDGDFSYIFRRLVNPVLLTNELHLWALLLGQLVTPNTQL
jgi:hypothetical protein